MKEGKKTKMAEVEPDALIGLEGGEACAGAMGQTGWSIGEEGKGERGRGSAGHFALPEEVSAIGMCGSALERPGMKKAGHRSRSERVRSAVRESPAGTPGSARKRRETGREDAFAVLHVAEFALQAVLRLEAERPVRAALLDETQRPAVVVACTAEARAAGVELGQTAAQAMARCAEVALRKAQPAAEAEAHAGLLAAAFGVSPQVEETAPGVCTLQVGGLAAERREPALQTAVAQLASLGLEATAGLAATPLLALQAARFGGRQNGRAGGGIARRVAFLAGESAGEGAAGTSDSVGSGAGGWAEEADDRAEKKRSTKAVAGENSALPAAGQATASADAIVVLRAGEERSFLQDLPLAVVEPTEEIAEILAGWGVRTLGGLTALPKAEVAQRLGPAGLALWERAAGETVRPLRLASPAQVFAAEMEWEEEIETLEPLLFILRRFVDRLALELRNAGFVAGEMVLELRLTDETVYTREFRLPEPTAREEILFRALHTHLETLHTAATVQGVALECRPVRPLTRQQGLFESGLVDPHGFAETLARVAAIVGAERVGTPVVENTHRPDAVKLVVPSAVVPPAEAERSAGDETMAGGGAEKCGLPLRRYRPPLGATVELAGESPVFVWAAGVAGAVRALAGPWRGSGEWWEAGRRWRREEWDVELEGGGVYRLLHAPEGWFVEGEYD